MRDVPNGWRIARVGDVAETALGKMLDAARPRGASRVPYLRNLNVQWGRIDLDDVQEVLVNEEEKLRFALEPGDLLVCEGGDIGRAAIWRGGSRYMAYQKALHRVRSRGDLDLSFLRYLLEHYASTGELRRRATGSTILHLPQRQLRELPIPLPPLTEQRRIVEILDDHLSRLETAQVSLRHARVRLIALRASTVINALRAASRDIAGERIRFGAAELPLPCSWQSSTIGDEAEVVEYGSGAKASEVRTVDSVPVLRMGNVKDGRIAWDSLKYLPSDHPDVAKLRLNRGDLLFNRTNSAELVGKSAVFDGDLAATFASYLIRVRLKDTVNPRWANFVINSLYGRAYVESVVSQQVGQANVNGTKLRAFPLPMPPRAMQDEIVAKLVDEEEASIRMTAQIDLSTERIEVLRRSLLASAFSGNLTGGTSEHDVIQGLASV